MAKKKAEEWIGKVIWMSRVNGQVEVDRGRMVWELLARPSMEHIAEPWWIRGRSACRKLESAQMEMGWRLLGASNTVAGVAVPCDLGWRKLEERREEMKVMFGKRLKVLKRADWLKSGK